MDLLNWVIQNSDKLSSIAILGVVICGLVYVVKKLHEQSRECEMARRQDLEERIELNRKLGSLETKVQTLSKLEVKVQTLEQLNQQVLMETLKNRNANN